MAGAGRWALRRDNKAEQTASAARTVHTARARPAAAAALTPHTGIVAELVHLQHTAGNRAVQKLVAQRAAGIQRQAAPPTAAAPAPAAASAPAAAPAANALPSAAELTTRIVRCIGIWETNRGKDNPNPRESGLNTLAGVSASMASVEQATMPYAIDALKAHKDLRQRATPEITFKELQDAEARVAAVPELLSAVAAAAAKGQSADDFIKNEAAKITATGLSSDDVKTMFGGVALKQKIDAAHTAVSAAPAKDKAAKLQAEIDAIPNDERQGIGAGSLRTYIQSPGTWSENRAAWQRKAVAAMPNNLADRINSVATADSGAALATAVVGARVQTELAKQPVPSEEQIVKTVAQKNNPGETDYGKNVWEKNYQRLYPAPKPAPQPASQPPKP